MLCDVLTVSQFEKWSYVVFLHFTDSTDYFVSALESWFCVSKYLLMLKIFFIMQLTQNKTRGNFARNYIHGESENPEHVSLDTSKFMRAVPKEVGVSKQNEPSLIWK